LAAARVIMLHYGFWLASPSTLKGVELDDVCISPITNGRIEWVDASPGRVAVGRGGGIESKEATRSLSTAFPSWPVKSDGRH
jgi:hypothetical protein